MSYDYDALHPLPQGWIRRSGIPVRYRGLSLEDCDTVRVLQGGKSLKVADTGLVEWLEAKRHNLQDDNARGLLLSGQPGTGKTRLMAILLQELARRTTPAVFGHSVMQNVDTPVGFIQFSDYIEKRKRMFSLPEDSDEWAKLDYTCEIFSASAGPQWDVRVAGFDDLGKEHATASRFSQDSFDWLLRRRFDKGYPTLVTSNLPRAKWGVYGESMVSFAKEAFTEYTITNVEGDGRG